ncbi:hypothetical protein DSM3645_09322 [Blastopirellula marina DSM 3645]|uniref:Uncharacterized protein n=1 Tax=Blastopirellula marina DSM 3645 TaxID=314230 RepID=A3ZLF5_9BACT|nr:hypothetical protein DSM3645_09322 [Blastopirellula marina DSM 3645]
MTTTTKSLLIDEFFVIHVTFLSSLG